MTTTADTVLVDARRQFQTLLRELFQFDSADLDFGIYRIMNHKRAVVDDFIANKLPSDIADALESGPLVVQTQAEERLETTARQVHEVLGEYAINAQGELDALYQNTPVGLQYLTAQADAASGRSRAALETDIYNGLYNFFRRYYQDGDFIAQRRYSGSGDTYAIPYNGQEVYLHWANRDQYYVKTAEHFFNYDWTADNPLLSDRPIKVQFRLQTANLEQNNVKGDKRFFLPQADQMQWEDADQRILTIPMEYRPLTPAETAQYGSRQQQENILKAAVTAIPAALSHQPEPLAALTAPHRHTAKGEPVTALETHLRRYAARNNADFFIHKDLSKFLNRELDFYLKNETLNLDHLLNAGPEPAAADFQKAQLMRQIGRRIIAFLGQLEGFQKSLWEKRKFVTQTDYCLTLGCIDQSFYPEIAANAAQWQEWQNLGFIPESLITPPPPRLFLSENPTLPLDTRHFPQDFTDRLLASFPDLDAKTDGILIHGDNWQALRLLEETYQGQVQCIYLDPPYNSKTTEILYKNEYKHSSWLSLLESRIVASTRLMRDSAVLAIAIDENEQERLGFLINGLFPSHLKTCVSVVHNPGGIQGDNFSYNNEFAYFVYPPGRRSVGMQQRSERPDVRPLRDVSTGQHLRIDAANCFYPIYIQGSQVVGFGDVCPDDFHPESTNVDLGDGRIAVYPIDALGNERKWVFSRQSVEKIEGELAVQWNKSRKIWDIIRRKTVFNYKTVWDDRRYNANSYGSKLLADILGKGQFSFPKSLYTVMDSVQLATDKGSDTAIVLDYFAGSGTTAHAVINLNREDATLDQDADTRRRFILVEQGEYFATVLLPRIKKAIYSPEWTAGQPKRPATPEEAARSPRIIKYLRLESYEDALDSIEFDAPAGELALEQLGDEYLLKYMLNWETKDSPTRLKAAELDRPFDYRLQVRERGEIVERKVDLPETFNWLLGLRRQTRQVYHRNGIRYLVYTGETRSEPGQKTVVLWRETAGWAESDYAADRDFIAQLPEVADAAAVYLNGNSALNRAGSRAIEPLFKERMFAGVEES